MSQQLYEQMRRLLEHIDQPCADERIEQLRQAIVKGDAATFEDHAEQCDRNGVLPAGFITRLAERHSLVATKDESMPAPSKGRQLTNVITRAVRAGTSIAKTSLNINRATDEQVEARLAICRQCPGNHAIWKNGDLHTCGPMLESMKRAGQGTCGCILRKKARDLTERCSFGWW